MMSLSFLISDQYFFKPFFGGMSMKQYSPMTFPCPKCSSVFNRKDNLQTHLKYECQQLPRFRCPHCHYISKKTSNVRAHIRTVHLGLKVYVIDLALQSGQN